jgi:hypothetical protein
VINLSCKPQQLSTSKISSFSMCQHYGTSQNIVLRIQLRCKWPFISHLMKQTSNNKTQGSLSHMCRVRNLDTQDPGLLKRISVRHRVIIRRTMEILVYEDNVLSTSSGVYDNHTTDQIFDCSLYDIQHEK